MKKFTDNLTWMRIFTNNIEMLLQKPWSWFVYMKEQQETQNTRTSDALSLQAYACGPLSGHRADMILQKAQWKD